MRDILFRGIWVHGNKEWIEGDLVRDSEGKPHIVDSKYVDYCHGEPIFVCEEECEVIPETVGQYTGLTDKNGKKIFEGDIVDCWSEGVNAQGTVQQRCDGLWIIYPAWQKHIMWGLCPDEYSHTTVEVIGNIHDNPELLEVK